MPETELNTTVKKDNKTPLLVISAAACIILLLVIWYLLTNSVDKFGSAAGVSYNNTYSSTKQEVYDDFYQKARNKAEADNHVSNRVDIVIDDIREISKLEVFESYDTEYVIHDFDEYEAWYELNGTCTYFIDLDRSEFLIDNERKTVTLRIPRPEQKFNFEPINKLLYDDGTIKILGVELNNGSIAVGVNDANNAYNEGRELIKNHFTGNKKLMNSAQESAIRILENLVKDANSEIEDLKVEVKFLDETT